MIKLPESTYYGKRMPKEKFYTNLEISPTIKRSFVDDVDYFVWHSKLSAATINIAEGKRVKEIALFEVCLKSANYNPAIFEVIDKNVAVFVVYIIKHNEKIRLLASYKEPNINKPNSFKILSTFVSQWQNEAQVTLAVDGIDLDAVYENFVRQIASERLQQKGDDIAKEIEQSQTQEKLLRQIAKLEARCRKEVQFNKQIELSDEIKQLKRLL